MNWLESTQITGGKRFYVLEENPPEGVKRLSAISIEKDIQGNWQGYVLTADRGFVAIPVQADHIRSLFDAIASRIPDELLIEEAQKRSAVAA